jgi:hypothetical protein
MEIAAKGLGECDLKNSTSDNCTEGRSHATAQTAQAISQALFLTLPESCRLACFFEDEARFF